MNKMAGVLGVVLLISILAPSCFSASASGPNGQKPVPAKKHSVKKLPQGKAMRVTASTVSLTVDDVAASSAFLLKHFGFHTTMTDGSGSFASLSRKDVGMTIIFLRRGMKALPKNFRSRHAVGVILAFTVTGLEAEERRLRGEGVTITMPLRQEAWGEHLFQVTDPNGIIIELVEWATP